MIRSSLCIFLSTMLSIESALALELKPLAITLINPTNGLKLQSSYAISNNNSFVLGRFSSTDGSSGGADQTVAVLNRATGVLGCDFKSAFPTKYLNFFYRAVSDDGNSVFIETEDASLAIGDDSNSTDLFKVNCASMAVSRLTPALDTNLFESRNIYLTTFSPDLRWIAYRNEAIDTNFDTVPSIVLLDSQATPPVATTLTQGDFATPFSLSSIDFVSNDGDRIYYLKGDNSGNRATTARHKLFTRSTGLSIASLDAPQGAAEPSRAASTMLITDNENKAIFVSSATDLVANDTNAANDLFSKDLATGVVTRLSLSLSGAQLDIDNIDSVIATADGRYVVARISANDILKGAGNYFNTAYLFDTVTGGIAYIGQTPAGVFFNGFTSFEQVAPSPVNGALEVVASSSAPNVTGVKDIRRDVAILFPVPVIKDACLNDETKLAPASCGCGVVDADANGNGVVDCIEPNGNTIPSAAPSGTVTKNSTKLVITLPAAPITGATYRLYTRIANAVEEYDLPTATKTLNVRPNNAYRISYAFILPNGIVTQRSPVLVGKVKKPKSRPNRRN